MVNNSLVEGLVYHERFKPFRHKFFYKIFQVKFSVDKTSSLKNKVLSLNRFNLFSLYDKDYLDGSDRPLLEKIQEFLKKENIPADGEIVLQTIPRILGYGFNPVSFWFIYNKNKMLISILAEVNNTFGDRHYYLMQGLNEFKRLVTNKAFHVSPFFDIEGEYHFNFNSQSVSIDYYDAKEKNYFFKSTLSNRKIREYNSRNLILLFFTYPMMTFFIMFRIHWQAVKLFFKKATFYPHPAPPELNVTKEFIRHE